MIGQHVLQDEALQARVHFMDAAKVSYITSADIFPVEDIKQEPQIPNDIQASFKSMYQQAKKVEWVIKEDRYKVNFLLNGSEMFAYLDRHGKWMKSFTKLSREELPSEIVSYLDSEYGSYQLTKFYLKNTPHGKSFTVAVKGQHEYVWLEFDQQGQLLNSPA
jgi:CTP:phosphocholine cytidylyltransferase-like protein